MKNIACALIAFAVLAVPLLGFSTPAHAGKNICVKFDKKGKCVQHKYVK